MRDEGSKSLKVFELSLHGAEGIQGAALRTVGAAFEVEGRLAKTDGAFEVEGGLANTDGGFEENERFNTKKSRGKFKCRCGGDRACGEIRANVR
jgi:hypothetical protein